MPKQNIKSMQLRLEICNKNSDSEFLNTSKRTTKSRNNTTRGKPVTKLKQKEAVHNTF